jgi:hypothetical protein
MDMGANLVPRVSGFYISKDMFDQNSPDNKVRDSVTRGCISPGQHRAIWFNLFLDNRGDADFHVGNPAQRPDVFTPPPYRFKEKFYTWRLTDNSGAEVKTGFKVAFCLMDFVPPRRYNCNDQGVSVGSYDIYSTDLACQFIEIDNLPDGAYTLHVTANAFTVQQVKNGQQPLPGLEEDNYEDNTVSVRLELNGDSVSVVDDTTNVNGSGTELNESSQIKGEFERSS